MVSQIENKSLLSESLIPLRDVGVRLRASRPTIIKWSCVGVRGVKLEILKLGNRYFSTEEAIKKFLQSQLQESPTAEPVE